MSDEPVNLLVSGNLVSVDTRTVSESFVTIDDGRIIALEERPTARELDTEYVAPGLTDAHMHVESSMVALPQCADAVVPRGIMSVVHGPHEVANVNDVADVGAMMADATRTPLKVCFIVLLSVPTTTLQDGGATLDAEAVDVLLGEDEVVTLGEMMNVPDVVASDDSIHEEIRAARDHRLTIDGYALRVHGSDLQTATRYLGNNHEGINLAEAREKVEAGPHVYLREGSASKNFTDVVGLVDEVGNRRLSLCTDDRDVVGLVKQGGVDLTVRKAIRLGVDPVGAVQMATVNTAKNYGLPFERIRPGAPADLILLLDLRTQEVDRVIVDGTIGPTKGGSAPPASAITTDAVRFEPVSVTDLAVRRARDYPVQVRIIDTVNGLQIGRVEADVPIAPVNEERALTANANSDVLPLAVIERYGETGGISRGLVRGFGLERGAIGSTVAHDAHSCVVAGIDHDSVAAVTDHFRDVGGGVATYDPRDNALSSLAPPIGGLMSSKSLGTVKEAFESAEVTADDLGLDRDGGLMTLSFLALEVIPTYRLTNNGLVDAESFGHVPTVID